MAQDQPGQGPTEPLGGPAPPPAPPTFAVAGPPREALAGFWRRLGAAFLDWLLVGILAAAIGQRCRQLPGRAWPVHPGRAGLLHLLPRHRRRPVDRHRILGIRVLEPTPAAPCPMPERSSGRWWATCRPSPCSLGTCGCLGTPQADLARHRRRQPGRQRHRLPTRRVRPSRPLSRPGLRLTSTLDSGPAALPTPGEGGVASPGRRPQPE
jgi:hypothetical protein